MNDKTLNVFNMCRNNIKYGFKEVLEDKDVNIFFNDNALLNIATTKEDTFFVECLLEKGMDIDHYKYLNNAFLKLNDENFNFIINHITNNKRHIIDQFLEQVPESIKDIKDGSKLYYSNKLKIILDKTISMSNKDSITRFFVKLKEMPKTFYNEDELIPIIDYNLAYDLMTEIKLKDPNNIKINNYYNIIEELKNESQKEKMLSVININDFKEKNKRKF